MVTRRHIRIKVMQTLYAHHQNKDFDLEKQEKFLQFSLQQIQELQALMLQLIIALKNREQLFLEKIQKKILVTASDKNRSKNFLENKVINQLEAEPSLKQFIEHKKVNNWEQDDEYVTLLYNDLKETKWYNSYLAIKNPTFQEDKEFVIALYKKIIAPSEKLYEYLEDKRLTWLDDFPLVNTYIVKKLEKQSSHKTKAIFNSNLYKDEEDKAYSLTLLRKVLLNNDKLAQKIEGKTPNWDKERIADLDLIILKMGIAEFLYFPSIPVRVTINEYIELAKEYSTPKSSFFINGILDQLVKEFTENGELNKIGRGLL